MFKAVARAAVGAVAPEWLRRYDVRQANARHGREFRDRLSACPTLDEKVDVAITRGRFWSHQKRAEILGLVTRVRDLSPARVCEIGTHSGGTLALFAQAAAPAARLLSLDIAYVDERSAGYPEFARPGQAVTTLEADSHEPGTLAAVRRWLAGHPVDFLFIDGDHSYAGVAADFAMYTPLVRPGGLVAFHDIVPDYRQRFGTPTESDVGEVPRFWAELKTKGYAVEELVENPDQDGMGIGVVRWDGAVR